MKRSNADHFIHFIRKEVDVYAIIHGKDRGRECHPPRRGEGRDQAFFGEPWVCDRRGCHGDIKDIGKLDRERERFARGDWKGHGKQDSGIGMNDYYHSRGLHGRGKMASQGILARRFVILA